MITYNGRLSPQSNLEALLQYLNSSSAPQLQTNSFVPITAQTVQAMFNVVSGGGGGGGGSGIALLKTATVTLTDAQIKALPTTAVEILSSSLVSAGKIAIPQLAYLRFKWFANYAGFSADASISILQKETFATPLGYLSEEYSGAKLSQFLAGGADADTTINPSSVVSEGSAPYAIGVLINSWLNGAVLGPALGLDLFCYNPLGNFTGGHASNTLKVTVWYVEVDV